MVDAQNAACSPAGESLRRAHARFPRRSGTPTETASPPPIMRRLLRKTVPVDGESLRGLVARACERNFIPNSWGVLQYLGLAHRNRVLVSEDPNLAPADLAYAVGTSDAEVARRRYDRVGANHVSFFGLNVRRTAIETKVRRFSPRSLSEHPYHRAIWELRDLPFCPFGWDLLQDRCHCDGDDGIVQGWTRTLAPVDRCDRCGDLLAHMEATPVPERMRGDLSFVLAIVGTSAEERSLGHALPAALVDVDRSLVFDLLLHLARAVIDMPPRDPRDLTAALAWCRALQTACRAIVNWPQGLRHLQPADHVDPRTWGVLTTKYASLAQPVPGPIENQGPWEARATLGNDIIGLKAAATLVGMKEETLAALWTGAVLEPHRKMFGGRLLPAFHPYELITFAARWHSRIGIQSFGYKLGISYHGVEQLIVSGLLSATAPCLPGTPPNISSTESEDFHCRVRSGAARDVDDPVPLRWAMTVIGGRLKPWGPIFMAMLQAEFPYAINEGSASMVDTIVIPRIAIRRLRHFHFDQAAFPAFSFARRMVQHEALATLNISARGARVLKGLEVVGVSPKTYAVTDVEERARAIITLPEIAFLLEEDYPDAHIRLSRAGWGPVFPGAYHRADTERELHRL
jgi:hypothetical protein